MFKETLDVSYYNNQNINQISAIPLSLQLDTALLLTGTIENKGWEVQFNATPFKLLISDGI
jgi:hypothetical protein